MWGLIQRLSGGDRKKRILFWALIIIVILLTVGVSLWFMGRKVVPETQNEDDFSGYEHVPHSLTKITCPTAPGLELEDYWRCLIRTSITSKGWEQDRQIKLFLYHERLRLEHEDTMERRNMRCSNETRKRRVRRQAPEPSPLLPFDPNKPETHYSFQKMLAITADLFFLDERDGLGGESTTFPRVRKCQVDYVWPGVSIRKFITCLLKIMHETKDHVEVKPEIQKYGYYDFVGHSLHSTFQPTTFPPVYHSNYDVKEFRVPTRVYINDRSRKFELHFDFQPLGNEEHLGNFEGADSFLDDNFSPYRYRYDNLDASQRGIAWSYRGHHDSGLWHELQPDKFLVPQTLDVPADGDVKKHYLQDMVQSYPGVGEVMEMSKHLLVHSSIGLTDDDIRTNKDWAKHIATPLDYKWKKDTGFYAYTRFLLPLLERRDLEYYRNRGYRIEGAPPNEEHVLYVLTNVLKGYLFQTKDSLYDELEPTYFSPEVDNYYYSHMEFIAHYFNVDITKWRKLKMKYGNQSILDIQASGKTDNLPYLMSMDMDAVRKVLAWYVDAIVPQVGCVHEMILESEDRRLFSAELEDVIEKTMKAYLPGSTLPRRNGSYCRLAVDRVSAEALGFDYPYRVPIQKLPYLYNSYFDRKDARMRYSIPSFPKAFPVCRMQDPSPIDIRATKTRHSTLKDYVFGIGAYRLNRFFMFLPLDGSPLLTIGIVDGQRLDESSVQLSGGTVKGENLTFQYAHIHFSNKWNKVGSEHWIDGKGATMEIQMVFTISGSADPIKYWHVLARMMNQLFQFRDKLVVVLSVLVDVVPTDEELAEKVKKEKLNQDPALFEPLAQAAYHFRSMPHRFNGYEEPRGYVSKDPIFRFIDFIPRRDSRFFTYRGGLSWPPCFPYVIWSVFEERLYMSKRQFDQFALIPAYGVQGLSTFASNNYRRFADIYVEEEHDTKLSYDERQRMIRERTADRFILVGTHEVEHEANFHQGQGIVGEEMYYANWDAAGVSALKPALLFTYLRILVMLCGGINW